ncbi:diguanylate cyclase, partial [Kineococcus sp. T13]|uniref:diguanylate cyclase domain-containing protein n=1 Tax=Kineococcus vitellinus TaxID=2696565 RepID=UPI0014123BC1|nr:diguanylate cyclase [Kineococcus vitellinus]
MSTVRRPPRLTTWAASTIALTVVLASLPDPSSPAGTLGYLVPVLVSTAWVVAAVARMPRGHRRPWLWLLAGQLLYLVGEVLFAVLAVRGVDAFPTAADLCYCLAYAPVAVGLLALNRRRTTHRYRGSLLDAGIVSLSAATLFGVFVVLPMASDATQSPLARTVSSAYPVCDVLLVFLVARLVTGPGDRPRAFWLLVAGSLCTISADLVTNVQQLTSGEAGYPRWVNALWLAYYAAFAVAAADSVRPWRRVEDPEAAGGLTAWRLLLLGVAAVLPSGVLVGASLTGHRVPVALLATGSIALVTLVVARVWDLLQRLREQSARLEALARTDPLTGIANRRTLDHELTRACRSPGAADLYAALVDLDRFKAYNDGRGHQAGDELLRAATAAWARSLGPDGFLARWGGEEFVVLLVEDDAARALRRLDALRAVVPDGQSCSIGVARWDRAEDGASLLRRADAALYAAKEGGRDRLVAPGLLPA